MSARFLVLITLIAATCLPGLARAQSACTDCHDSVDAARFGASAHHGLQGETGKPNAACTGCHGEFALTEEGHAKPAPVDCARCHRQQSSSVLRGVHHREDEGKGVGCADCHGQHYVTRLTGLTNGERKAARRALCGQCHEKAGQQYDHGQHGKSGSPFVATCVDCHGSHQVLDHVSTHLANFRRHLAETCATCHASPDSTAFTVKQKTEVQNYFNSVHGLAMSRSGLVVSATCSDCHGAHDIALTNAQGSPVARAKVPETCGSCHPGVAQVYMESVHGEELARGNIDVPVCTDCHHSHQIRSHYDPTSSVYATHVADTCLRCHGNEGMITKYGFPGLRAETYLQSYHGAAGKLGDTEVANCASCHSSHDIRKSTDPVSSTHPSKLHDTCGRCHKTDNPSDWMAVGKIHVTTAEESHWVTNLVQRVYLVLISVTLSGFVLFILLDLRRKLRGRH